MTKEEAAQYQRQWNIVNQARIEEVRGMSTAEKIRDLEILFEFGQNLGWSTQGDPAWVHWRKLKELSNV